MAKSLLRKLKDNKGGLDSSLSFVVIAIILFMLTYQMFFAQPFFSDRRVTEDYIELSRDLICRQTGKIEAVNSFLISKLAIIQGQIHKDYILKYYVQRAEDDWSATIDITSQIGTYPLRRGDLLIIYFKKLGTTPYERVIKKDIGTVIVKTGMVEMDMD